MVLKLAVAPNTTEIGPKVRTATFCTPVRFVRFMRVMRVFAFAAGSPLVHVKSFAPRQPVLTNFLRSTRNEFKFRTRTVKAVGYELPFC